MDSRSKSIWVLIATVWFFTFTVFSTRGLAQKVPVTPQTPGYSAWESPSKVPSTQQGDRKTERPSARTMEAYGVRSLENVSLSGGQFVPAETLDLRWSASGPDTLVGYGKIGMIAPVGELSTFHRGLAPSLQYSVSLPPKGKAIVEIQSSQQEMVLRKDAILGMYDLSRASSDSAITPLLAEMTRTAEDWDVGIYAWKPEYIELRLFSAHAPGTPVRIYALPNVSGHDTKRKLDGYVVSYYWLAASRAVPKAEDQEVLRSVARRVTSTEAVSYFLKLQPKGQ